MVSYFHTSTRPLSKHGALVPHEVRNGHSNMHPLHPAQKAHVVLETRGKHLTYPSVWKRQRGIVAHNGTMGSPKGGPLPVLESEGSQPKRHSKDDAGDFRPTDGLR